MASTDAKPFSLKNTAYRVTFPILDADGDLVTGAAGLDSEISKDGGTFADCTNEATEIATASGMYYLDLTATEMNADTVAIIVKTSTSGAKTTPIVMYPVEDTDIPVNVKAISDDTTAPDNLELMYDGTGYAGGTTKLGVNVTQLLGTAWLTPGVAGTPDVNTKLLGGTVQTGNDVGADVNEILTDTGTTLDTLIKDIPTVAEFEARSILAAEYVVVGDTIAGVTAVTNDVGITQAAADKVRASVCVTGDPANSIGKVLYELYTNRLTSTRAGYLDELGATNIPADIDTLLLRLSATRTGYIDNLSAGSVALATICTEARLAHLDADMTSRSSHAAADVWSVGTRSLTGKTGFSLSTSGIDAIWDELTSGHTAAGSFGQRFQIVRTATVQTSTKYKTTLDIAASTVDNFYNTEVLYIVGGTGAGQSRKIESYNGSTKKATVTTGWSTNPDNTSIFIIFPTSVETGSGASAQQVWEYATREITDKTDFLLAASQEVQLNAQGKLDVNVEADTALTDIKLDHLVAVADSDDPVNDSIIAKLAASDGDWSGFDKATEALEAIRDRGDSAWITGAGESAANVADAVWDELIADHTGGTTFGGKNQKVVPSETLADYKADVASLALEATLTAMKGATYVESTDSLEALRNRGDAAWVTATGFSTHAAADIWSVGTRALTDKAGFSLSTAGILAIWHQLTANIVTANTIGKLLKDDINATISSRSSHSAADVWSAGSRALSTPADYKADVSALALEATLTDIKGTGFIKDTHSLPQCITATGFSTHAAADIWSVGTRTLTDKAGFTLSSAAITAIWEKNISAFSGAGYAGTYLKTLYADWLNGGRLDLILDIIAADVVNLDGDAMRGTDSANTTTPPTVNEIADQVWDELLTGGSHNISTSAGRRLRELAAYAVESGTAQAGTTTTITLAAGASANDGIYNRNLIVISSGTGLGQTRTIAEYKGATKVCAIDREWRITPDATSEYQILAEDTPLVVDHGLAQAGTATTITLRDYASAVNDAYLCNIIAIIGGTGRGQARLVGSYVGSTKVVTICGDNWVTTPDTTSVYAMVPYGTTCGSCMGTHALGQINTECDTALTDYDPPTRTEATADKDAIITEVDANETKIDTIDGVVDAILLDTGTDGVVITSGSKTGYTLSAAGVDAIMDEIVEGTLTFRQMLRLFTSVLAGKSAGGGTVTLTFRDVADGKDRISTTVDSNGNRTAITLDGA